MKIQIEEFSLTLRIDKSDPVILDYPLENEDQRKEKIDLGKCWIGAGNLSEKIKNHIKIGLLDDINAQGVVDLIIESFDRGRSGEIG